MLKKSGFTLYEDQEVSVAALLDKVQNGIKRSLFVGATGSGKTAISAELKRRLYPKKMLFVVHRDVLIEQTIATLVKTGFPLKDIGAIAGRYSENRSASIQILSIQTAPRRNLDWFQWDVCFFDEGHTTGWSDWALKLHRSHGDRPIIYLTATPWRLSKKQSFTDIVSKDDYVFAPLPKELIEMGRLAKPIYYKALEVKLGEVKKQGGDYKVSDLAIVCNNPEVISAGLNFWQEKFPNERTIAFAVTVEHAETIVKMSNEAGRQAVIVHGDTPITERDRHYKALRDHTIDMIVSVDCLSEGFDVPNIRCVWDLAPTLSKAKFYQRIGRGLRVYPGKENCIILCQSGNLDCHKNGHKIIEELDIEDFFDSSTTSKGDAPPPRICANRDLLTWEWMPGGCGAVIGSRVTICPYCGFVLPVKKDKAIAIGKVIEVKAEKIDQFRANPNGLDEKQFFVSLMDEIFTNRWSPAAANFRFKEAFGKKVPEDFFWRWTRYRKKSTEDLKRYLTAVDNRKQSNGYLLKTWLPKLTPPEDEPRTIAEIWEKVPDHNSPNGLVKTIFQLRKFSGDTAIVHALHPDLVLRLNAQEYFQKHLSNILKQPIAIEFVYG